MKKYIFLLFVTFFLASCTSQLNVKQFSTGKFKLNTEEACFNFSNLSSDDQKKADSLLHKALHEEALHTLVSTIKPMSDVESFKWKIDVQDTLYNSEVVSINQAINYKNEYEQIERISEVFSCGPLSSAVFPFENLYNGERYVQFRIYRTDSINEMVESHPEFWSRWAFVKESNPAIMISVIEYESRLNRYRGYGYLYGYPDHAVDFFVEAAQQEDESGKFVERDFINLPVVSGESGRFVYAVKKEHTLTPADKVLHKKAQSNVNLYLNKIQNYHHKNGKVDNVAFLRELYKQEGWIH